MYGAQKKIINICCCRAYYGVPARTPVPPFNRETEWRKRLACDERANSTRTKDASLRAPKTLHVTHRKYHLLSTFFVFKIYLWRVEPRGSAGVPLNVA